MTQGVKAVTNAPVTHMVASKNPLVELRHIGDLLFAVKLSGTEPIEVTYQSTDAEGEVHTIPVFKAATGRFSAVLLGCEKITLKSKAPFYFEYNWSNRGAEYFNDDPPPTPDNQDNPLMQLRKAFAAGMGITREEFADTPVPNGYEILDDQEPLWEEERAELATRLSQQKAKKAEEAKQKAKEKPAETDGAGGTKSEEGKSETLTNDGN